MPRGKPWPPLLLLGITQKLLEEDGWTEQGFNRLTKEGQEKLAFRYLRKAKNSLHDLYVLGLIEVGQA